jgi:hypothetical protein
MKNTTLFPVLGLASLLFTACEDDPQAEQPTSTEKCASSQYRDAKGQCIGTRNDTNPTNPSGRSGADAAAAAAQAEAQRRIDVARQECSQRTGFEWNSIANTCDQRQTSPTQIDANTELQRRIEQCRTQPGHQWDTSRQTCAQIGTFIDPNYSQDSLRIECVNRGFGYVWDYNVGQCYEGNGSANEEIYRCNNTPGMAWSPSAGQCLEQNVNQRNAVARCNTQSGYQWSTRYSRCVVAVTGSNGSEFRLLAQRDTFLISPTAERNCFIPRGTEILIDSPAIVFSANKTQATIRSKGMTQGQCTTGDWNIFLDHF